MLERVLVAFVGLIVVGVWQSLRRGAVTEEERQSNPTVVESLASAGESFASAVRDRRDEATFRISHRHWFSRFESNVSQAMTLAASQMEIARKCEDPDYKRFFEGAMTSMEAATARIEARSGGRAARRASAEVPEWVLVGPPTALGIGADSMHQRVHDEIFDRHAKFIAEMRYRLVREPRLQSFFKAELSKRGLNAIGDAYFSDPL